MRQTFIVVSRNIEYDLKNEIFIDIIRIPYFSFISNKWTDSIKYIVFISEASKSTVLPQLHRWS